MPQAAPDTPLLGALGQPAAPLSPGLAGWNGGFLHFGVQSYHTGGLLPPAPQGSDFVVLEQDPEICTPGGLDAHGDTG